MKLSVLMLIKAIIVFVFGIVFVLIPRNVMSFYGMTLQQDGALMTQFFGASFILLGIVLWAGRKASRNDVALKAIVLAVTVGDLIGFIVALLGQLRGVMNVFGWGNVALYLILALAFGYFLFTKPTES
ncbi:hypothetical protein JXQ31_02540 [candidate division KSB1 bacterium]|nr:hypothetical protein [candidate division KSB1 bacterium]